MLGRIEDLLLRLLERSGDSEILMELGQDDAQIRYGNKILARRSRSYSVSMEGAGAGAFPPCSSEYVLWPGPEANVRLLSVEGA
jgi:hypothetical protein